MGETMRKSHNVSVRILRGGGRKRTSYIGQYIMENYEIPDRS